MLRANLRLTVQSPMALHSQPTPLQDADRVTPTKSLPLRIYSDRLLLRLISERYRYGMARSPGTAFSRPPLRVEVTRWDMDESPFRWTIFEPGKAKVLQISSHGY